MQTSSFSPSDPKIKRIHISSSFASFLSLGLMIWPKTFIGSWLVGLGLSTLFNLFELVGVFWGNISSPSDNTSVSGVSLDPDMLSLGFPALAGPPVGLFRSQSNFGLGK